MPSEYTFPHAFSVNPIRIRGENVPAFLKEVNTVIRERFNDNKHLKVLAQTGSGKDAVAVGSNSLILPVVQIVLPEYRVGRPEDLQRTLNDGDTLSIRGNNYVDLGAVLDFTGRNHEMALDFYDQLSVELQSFERLPAVVVGYGLKNIAGGNYGLGLVRTENTQIRPAKILAEGTAQFRDADVSLDTGLPSKLVGEKNDRTLYTSPQRTPSLDNLGLSGLFLLGCLDLVSNCECLASSFDSGRVVLF